MELFHGLYRPGSSGLHRLHPLTKLALSGGLIAAIFLGPGGWVPVALSGLLAGVMLWRAGLAGLAWRLGWRLLAPAALALFVVHGLFSPENQTIWLRLGPLRLGGEGVAFAALVAARLAGTLGASFVLALSTPPAELLQALEEAGLPRGLAYVMGSPLILLPQLAGQARAIRAAQQARGLETEGGLWRRAKAVLPLVGPLVYQALIDVEERSLALEARGFSATGPKTQLRALSDSPRQRAARRGFWVWLVLLAAARVAEVMYAAG